MREQASSTISFLQRHELIPCEKVLVLGKIAPRSRFQQPLMLHLDFSSKLFVSHIVGARQRRQPAVLLAAIEQLVGLQTQRSSILPVKSEGSFISRKIGVQSLAA